MPLLLYTGSETQEACSGKFASPQVHFYEKMHGAI